MRVTFGLLTLVACSFLRAQSSEPHKLAPDQAVDRTLAGGIA